MVWLYVSSDKGKPKGGVRRDKDLWVEQWPWFRGALLIDQCRLNSCLTKISCCGAAHTGFEAALPPSEFLYASTWTLQNCFQELDAGLSLYTLTEISHCDTQRGMICALSCHACLHTDTAISARLLTGFRMQRLYLRCNSELDRKRHFDVPYMRQRSERHRDGVLTGIAVSAVHLILEMWQSSSC